MKHFDPTIFVSDLSLKLINLNPEADVNTLTDEFVKIFNDTLDTHAPYRYASRKEQRSFYQPWLTKGILTSIAKKNNLYRKQLTTKNPNIIRKYITYRNKLTHLKEISKQNFYKQAFQKCHHDIKKNMEACQWNNSNKKQIPTKKEAFLRLRMPKTMWRFEQFFLTRWKIPFYKNKTIPNHLQTFYYTYKSKTFIISSSYRCIWNPTSHQKP